MPPGSLLLEYVGLVEMLMEKLGCSKVSQVELYEAILAIDSTTGYNCLGISRCNDARALSSIIRKVADWYRWMATDSSRLNSGTRALEAAGCFGQPLERIMQLVGRIGGTDLNCKALVVAGRAEVGRIGGGYDCKPLVRPSSVETLGRSDSCDSYSSAKLSPEKRFGNFDLFSLFEEVGDIAATMAQRKTASLKQIAMPQTQNFNPYGGRAQRKTASL